MNKYIEYIKTMKQDPNVDSNLYKELIEGFKIKLENWLMERPRFSDDPDFIEMTTAIKYISISGCPFTNKNKNGNKNRLQN